MDIFPMPDLNRLIDEALEVGGEPLDFDLKGPLVLSSLSNKLKLVKTITSFANTEKGGHVFIGISDTRAIEGLPKEEWQKYDQTEIQKLLAKYIAPVPNFQVRQHIYHEKNLVVIHVYPFSTVPHFVVHGVEDGPNKIVQGVIYVRTTGAECCPVYTDDDVRTLCNAIIKRNADAFVDLIQRGLPGYSLTKAGLYTKPNIEQGNSPEYLLTKVSEVAKRYWSDNQEQRPYIETFFAPTTGINIDLDTMREIIPKLCVPETHGFPFNWDLGANVHTLTSDGWIGTIPYKQSPDDRSTIVEYFWLLDRSLTFLNRDPFWEDKQNSVIPNGIGLYHIIGLVIVTIRFLRRLAKKNQIADDMLFYLGVKCVNVQGRQLDNELAPSRHSLSIIDKHIVTADIFVSHKEIRENPNNITATLVEEIAWQCGRTNLSRSGIITMIDNAKYHLGSNYSFPQEENIEDDPWNVKNV